MNHTVVVTQVDGRWEVVECSRPDLIPVGTRFTTTDLHVLRSNGGWEVQHKA
jgi:hypothetical protein